MLGFGPRSSALGATGAAGAEGYEAVYGNPALLSLARSRELAVGITSAVFDVHAGAPVSYEPLHGSVIGAVLPVPFGGILKDRIALGLGFFTPFDLVVRGPHPLPRDASSTRSPTAPSRSPCRPGIGVDLGHGVRIGGGFAALAALSGTVLVATDASGRIGTTVDDTLVASYGPIVGASYDIGDAWRLGAHLPRRAGGALQRGHQREGPRHPSSSRRSTSPASRSTIRGRSRSRSRASAARGSWPLGAHLQALVGLPRPRRGHRALPRRRSHDGHALHRDVHRARPRRRPATTTPSSRASASSAPSRPRRGVDMRLRGGVLLRALARRPRRRRRRNLYDNHRAAFTLGYGVEVGPPAARVALDLFGQAQALIPRDNVKAAERARPTTRARPSVTTSGVIGAFGATVGVKF